MCGSGDAEQDDEEVADASRWRVMVKVRGRRYRDKLGRRGHGVQRGVEGVWQEKGEKKGQWWERHVGHT